MIKAGLYCVTGFDQPRFPISVPGSTLNLEKVVMTTEAHPFKIEKNK